VISCSVAILTAENPPQSGVGELLEAHRALGHRVRVIHLSEMTFMSNLPKFPGGLPDVAHSRASALWGLAAQEALEEVMPIINTTAGQRAGRDKWVCARKLSAAGVDALPTFLATPGVGERQVCEVLSDDVVMKPMAGFGGQGVTRLRGRAEIGRALREMESQCVMQPYCHVGGRDLRAVVVGGRVIASVERQAQGGEFRANASLGALVRPAHLDRQTEKLAIRAARACGLDMAGVDIIEPPDGPLVVEVNTNTGGLDQMHSLTKVDVAREMAMCVEARFLEITTRDR
jgi:ribosomal protein S6--L-glutamate ligase